MKKLFPALIALAIVFLIVSFFIPVQQVKTVSIENSLHNTITALHQPTSWRSLDSGKNTHITDIHYMLYRISEPKNKEDSTTFELAVGPDAPQHNPNGAAVSWLRSTPLFYKLFAFLEKPTFDNVIVDELRSYLQDNTHFYGYPMTTQRLVDSIFLTKKQDIPARDLFKTLPRMVKELEDYARTNSCRVIAKNISIVPLDHDSISIMAGLNIDKAIPGDETYNCRELPSTLGLLVGRYEGRFKDRTGIYTAMEKYLVDHALAKRGVPFERYDSPLPDSDSANIKIDLIYPVTYR